MKTFSLDDSIVQIRHAETQDGGVLLDILNRATNKLLEKGVRQWTSPWKMELVNQAIEAGEQFLAVENGEIVAVFRLSDKSTNPAVEAIRPGNLYLSQLAVDALRQNLGVGKQVMQQVLAEAAEQNKTLYLDCWAGNKKLKAFYEDCGMQSLGDFPEDNYYITVFRAPFQEQVER